MYSREIEAANPTGLNTGPENRSGAPRILAEQEET